MKTLEWIRYITKKYNLYAAKKFGQNFLIDDDILKKIIEVANIKNKEVIEIGPGLASLTRYLAKEAKIVDAFEVDERIIEVLKKELNDNNVNVHFQNFLTSNLDFQTKKIIVANIPYNITSHILFKLYENNDKFDHAILMVQKEVAKRLIAKVKTKQYGKLAITSQFFADIEYCFDVPPNSFVPAPKVTSAIVKLTFKKKDYKSYVKLVNFIKTIFSHQRKTLLNNLKNVFEKDKAEKIINEFIEKHNLNLKVRPQELTIELIEDLFKISNEY